MDGIHDLGGREGYGPIDVRENENPFHAPWEPRVLGITKAMTRPSDWSLDWFRHCRELIDPAEYLTRGYYDQWLSAYSVMLVNSGVATIGELASGRATSKPRGFPPPMAPAEVASANKLMINYRTESTTSARFTVGQEVRTIAHGHSGHIRLPAYARGQRGRVESYHGFHVLPDANAFGNPLSEPLYTVAFDRAALWLEQIPNRCTVHLDLWESYLE